MAVKNRTKEKDKPIVLRIYKSIQEIFEYNWHSIEIPIK
jgi:hypothetical protein